MSQFSGLAVCSVTHLEWEDGNGKYFKGILITPIAGKIPSKRILYTPFFPELEKSQNGESFILSFYETKPHKELGRRFQWTVIPFFEKSEFPMFIKKLGPSAIINVEDTASSPLDHVDSLTKEKLRYESEIKYFKAKAHKKHLEKNNCFGHSEEDHANNTKGYDPHDVYIAFDGDIDSMNEFLGNH